MEDDNQIEPPPSFVALYTAPGGHRLLQPAAHVRERYGLCEDLAQLGCERAAAEQFRSGAPEREVLERLQAAFAATPGVTEPEAVWVVRRVAELLEWPAPR